MCIYLLKTVITSNLSTSNNSNNSTDGGGGSIYLYPSAINIDIVNVINSSSLNNGGFLYFNDGYDSTTNKFLCDNCNAQNYAGDFYIKSKPSYSISISNLITKNSNAGKSGEIIYDIEINHRGIISVNENHDSSKDNDTTLFDNRQVINCTTYYSLFYLIGDISPMVQSLVEFTKSQFISNNGMTFGSILVDSNISNNKVIMNIIIVVVERSVLINTLKFLNEIFKHESM